MFVVLLPSLSTNILAVAGLSETTLSCLPLASPFFLFFVYTFQPSPLDNEFSVESKQVHYNLLGLRG